MKQKLKRINRGIVLAVIILVVLTVYVAASAQSFKSTERDRIEEFLTSYSQDILQCSVIPADCIGTEGQNQAMSDNAAKAKEIIEKSWIQSEALENYNCQVDMTTSYYNLKSDYLLNTERNGSGIDSSNAAGVITDASCKLKITKIKQNGPNGATVTADITYYLSGRSNPSFYGVGDVLVYYFYGIGDVIDYYSDNLSSKPSKLSYHDLELQLYKEDGEWKIAGVDLWSGVTYEE